MLDLLFSNGATWFTIPALLGTMLFAIRMAMMLLGAEVDAEVDMPDVDVDLDAAGDVPWSDADVPEPHDFGFHILSLSSIGAFAMGFGWGGFAGFKGMGWSMLTSTIVAIACGAAMVWLLVLLLKGAHDLQSHGNVRIDSAVGLEGDVYAGVPGESSGKGQVTVIMGGRQRTYNATTQGETLPRGTRVKVIKSNEDNTLTVVRA